MRLDRNTYGTVLLVYFFCALAIFLLWRFVPVWWLNALLTLGLLWVCAWQTYFHMVPDRIATGSDRLVSAVSDGKVVHVEQVFESRYLQRECIQVSVYMDFWDLHANFWPVTGVVS